MSMSTKCVICDLAFEMGKSELEFYGSYTMEERAQLYASYVSRMDRATVMAVFPLPPPKG